MTKDEVAAALDEIGTLLELKGENPSDATPTTTVRGSSSNSKAT